MGGCVFFVIKIIGLSVLAIVLWGGSASASDAWLEGDVTGRGIAERPYPSNDEIACSQQLQFIVLKGQSAPRTACVYGVSSGMQVARYRASFNLYEYGVRFSYEDTYTPVKGLCTRMADCVYSQKYDTFIAQVELARGTVSQIIESFSEQLVLQEGSVPVYRVDASIERHYISRGGIETHTNAVSISQNGEWAVVELEAYGFVRLNLETRELRRVVAPSGEYGYGANPSYELAVSNDGRLLAVVGVYTAIELYAIDDACGDTLSSDTQRYFAAQVTPCRYIPYHYQRDFPDMTVAHLPRFSAQGDQLSVVVRSMSNIVNAVITPTPVGSVQQFYVAYGDSFTSGEGELSDAFYLPETNSRDNKCHVSVRSYPYLTGVDRGIAAHNRACSGSRVADVYSALQRTPAETPSHLTVSVGGNDAGLMGKLVTCLGLDVCEWARDERRYATYEELRAVASRLVALYQHAKGEHPETRVFAVGYPLVINPDAAARCGPLIQRLLQPEEREYMNESIRLLNRVVHAAADEAGIAFIDIEEALVGERLCEGRQKAMNEIRLGDDIAPMAFLENLKLIGAESFHPTPEGHARIARYVSIRLSGGEESDCECSVATLFEEVPTYWQGGSQFIQRAGSFLSHSVVDVGQNISIQLPKNSFASATTVQVAVHSDKKSLGEFTVAHDGSFTADVAILSITPGYHTVHLYGVTPSGVALDIYQMLAVGLSHRESFSPEVHTGVIGVSGERAGEKEALPTKETTIQGSTNIALPTEPYAVVLGKGDVRGAAIPRPADGTEASRWYVYLAGAGLITAIVAVIVWRIRHASV